MKKVTDEKLWEMAEKRVGFRRHLFVYICVNILLVVLWYFSSYKEGNTDGYWFAYPLLGWGIGLAFHYWGAYHDDLGSVEREYDKIKQKYKATDFNEDSIHPKEDNQ